MFLCSCVLDVSWFSMEHESRRRQVLLGVFGGKGKAVARGEQQEVVVVQTLSFVLDNTSGFSKSLRH